NLPRGLELRLMAAGLDGTTIALDKDGNAFAITSTGGVVPRRDFPPGIHALAVVTSTLMYAYDKITIFRYDGQWRGDRVLPPGDSVNAIAADEKIALYVGNTEVVRVRDPSGQWMPYPTPMGITLSLNHAAGLGDGRFVVVGGGGLVA